MNRRQFATAALASSVGMAAAPLPWSAPANASAIAAPPRRLAFTNTHTGECFDDCYWEAGNFVPEALRAIELVMRDHRTGEVHEIDPRLLDQLVALRALTQATAPYQIISGYRSPASNASLAAQSSGVATRSLHMQGRAIDVRVSGVDLVRLRDAALGMAAGGVGYYAASDFVHLDTGRVRSW